MKNTFYIAILLAVVSAFIFSSCGQTEEDIIQEALILGDWYAVDNNGDTLNSYNVPAYHFDTANNGYSKGNSIEDEFKWEIKRGQLKIYYETAPSYYIGYDKYNSQSLMRLQEISENWFEVTQFYSDGFQSDLKFNRIIEE